MRRYLAWYVAQVHAGRERVFAASEGAGCAYVAERGELCAEWILARSIRSWWPRCGRGGCCCGTARQILGADGYVRITIGVEEHVTRGIAVLRESLAEIGWTPKESVSANGRAEGEREYE